MSRIIFLSCHDKLTTCLVVWFRKGLDLAGLHLLPVAIGQYKRLIGMGFQNVEDRPERGVPLKISH